MNKFMSIALEEAYEGINAGHGGPFGAVVVKDGTIVGRGHNRVLCNNDPTAHGEISAIRNACENIGSFSLEGCELYTTAQPCPMCMGAILWAGIKKVFYGCNVQDTAKIGFSDDEFYDIMKSGKEKLMEPLEREKCLELFNDYTKNSSRKHY